MKNLTSGTFNTMINLIGQNELKKSEVCVQGKCICLASLFV